MSVWHRDFSRPPWRQLDNRERRAQWAQKYYMQYEPLGHPMQEKKEPKHARTRIK